MPTLNELYPNEVKIAEEIHFKIEKGLIYAYQRWEDEKEYEDFKDYQIYMQKVIPDYPIKKMTQRPFGFYITIGPIYVRYTIKTDKTHIWTNREVMQNLNYGKTKKGVVSNGI